MAPAAAVLSITEEPSFAVRVGCHVYGGLARASTWEGLTKYTTPAGEHLIVHDAEQRVIDASEDLGGWIRDVSAPKAVDIATLKIGEPLAGGIYAGLTELFGKPARLVLMPGEASDVSWDEATKWAALNDNDLPTRKELITLYENLKSEFAEKWYWSSQQHEVYAGSAWGQYFDNGTQYYTRKSYAGRARAVRRLPI